MDQCITNQIKELIPHLKEVDSKLQGESIKLFSDKESIIVERRKPVIEEMLKHLESSSITNCNTMIDAETGFGKTYDIGLWSHVLAQAGYHHLVAAPIDNLVEQAKKMIDGAFIVDVKTPKTVQEIKDALKVTEPTTIIVTHDLLLQQENDRKFEEQNGEKPKLWVSVDEADSINQQQAFENMCELDKVYPTTYLTATPKRRILNRCGKVISPTRSSRRCIATTIKTMSVIAKTNGEKFSRALAVSIALLVIPSIVLLPVINSHVAIIAARIGLISNFWLYSFLIGSLNFIVSGIILSIIMAPIVWVTRKITDVDSNELFLRAIANLFDLVDKGRSSPAHEYVEECEETFTYNKLVDSNNLLESVRWNVQTPIGENALILVDNINSIKNLNFALQGMDDLVYIDGRVRLRHIVYDVSQPGGMSYRGCFNSEELDPSKYVKEYFPSLKEEEIQKLINTIGKLPPDYKFKKYDFIKNVKKCSPNLREEQISTLIGGYRFKLRVESFINCVKKQHPNLTEAQISELKEKVDFSDTAQYLKYRVMHSMIDLTLSCLMECDNIALDKRRKEDLGKLIEDVKNKVSIVDDNSIIAFLHGKGFREQFAEEKLLPQIKTVIKTLNECSDEQRRLIVDNWHLNKELHNLIEKEGGVLRGLSNFCEENKCIFAKLGKNDLGIKEGEPFFKITFDQKGTKITFDHKSTTYSYCNYKDADLDALAKCALTTIIDGSKGRGFDGEYNHVASIFTDSTSQFNNPAETLQNLGRNREHNSNRQPWFFVAAGEKVELFVDKVLANLKNEPRGFCRKILFPATDRYNKLVKNRMGVELGEKIEIHISENMDVLGNIDDAALKEFLDNSIKEVYKKVHDMNDFDVKKTEKDVHNICKSAEKYLRSCEDRIKNNGKLPFTEKVIFFVASAIIKAIYYIWFAFDYVVFAVKSCTLNEKNDGRNVLAYAYLIKNCSLKKALMYREISQACEPLWKKIKEDMAKMQLSDAKKFVEKEVDLLQSKAYINTLDKSISSLLSKEEGKKHLLTILDAIYPNQSNKNKLKEIVAFKEDLSRLKYGEMVSKCCKKETDLYSIIQLINNINEEIIKCQAYYHNVNTLIYVDEPKLKTHHDLFNIRVVYSKKTLDDSYGKLHPSHSKLLFLERLNRVARGIIVLGLFPLLIRPITPIGSLLVSTVLLTLICYQSEVLRKFLFFANIRNDTRSAVNELDLLSKQSEVKCMNKVANVNFAATNLSSPLIQQIFHKPKNPIPDGV